MQDRLLLLGNDSFDAPVPAHREREFRILPAVWMAGGETFGLASRAPVAESEHDFPFDVIREDAPAGSFARIGVGRVAPAVHEVRAQGREPIARTNAGGRGGNPRRRARGIGL